MISTMKSKEMKTKKEFGIGKKFGAFWKKEFGNGGWLAYVALTLAGIVNAFGITWFLFPANLMDGGLSGTSVLLDKVTPDVLSMSIFLLILNFPFYLFAWKKMGGSFVIRSLYVIVVYSVFSFLIQNYISPESVTVSPIASMNGVNDMLLCCLFGGLISGIGSGLTIRSGGAMDGIEVMAIAFAKYLGLTVGTFVMIYNIGLYLIAALIFHNWEISLYSIIAYFVGLKTIDFIVEGLDKAKSATIITTKSDEMAQELCQAMGRGVTVMDGTGFYSGQPRKILLCVVNRFQIGRLKNIVTKVDQSAFVTITDVSDTLGTSLKLSRVRLTRKVKPSGKHQPAPVPTVVEEAEIEQTDEVVAIEPQEQVARQTPQDPPQE